MVHRPAIRSYVLLTGLVFLAGLSMRVALACTAQAVTRDAATSYLPLAQGWQFGLADKAFSGGIPPLYPMATGLFARLTGDLELAGRTVSIFGGMLVIVFVYLLAKRLFGRWTALLAAALVAFHPYLCEFSAEVGPDSVSAGLLAMLVYTVCAYLLTFSFWNVLLAAVAMAGLALTRPEGFAYAPLAWLVMLVWRTKDKPARVCPAKDAPALRATNEQYRRRGTHVALLLVILGALCVPRLISVHRQTGLWALDTRQKTWTARFMQAVKNGKMQYGQWRIWTRDGWPAVADTVVTTAAGLGPAALFFGIYGLIASRRLPRRRVAMVVALFVAYSIVLVLVGNRISKRYLLSAAGIWQVWGALGIMLLFLRLRARIVKRPGYTGARPDRSRRFCRALPVIAGLLLASLQLPWAIKCIGVEFKADRLMGEWMAANLPNSTRVMAMETVPLWYARAVQIKPPRFRPSRLKTADLALMAGQVNVDYILVDTRGHRWAPNIWPDLQKGQWRYGKILYRTEHRSHTLYLLDVSKAHLAKLDTMPKPKAKPPAKKKPAPPPTTRPKARRAAAKPRVVASQPTKAVP